MCQGVTSLKGQAGKVVEYTVTCMLPSKLGDVSPVLLSELEGAAFEGAYVSLMCLWAVPSACSGTFEVQSLS